jgi:hypothetical protein
VFVSSSASRLRDQRGQVIVVAVVAMLSLLGIAGLVIDVGAWYHQQRDEQATADAAALAGAQALPDDPSTAVALALQYANSNGAGLTASDVTISSDRVPDDTIAVHVGKLAPTFFTKLFGVNSLSIHATAAARSDTVSSAEYVAPITVSSRHPMLQCKPPPCTEPTEIDLLDLKQKGSSAAAGNFGLLDLRIGANGAVGDSTLADWMLNGYNQDMPLGVYTSAPGAKFNGSQFDSALQARVGSEVLFPVYKPPITQSGSNAQFNIIGWVGFRISGWSGQGNSGKVFGSFTRFIAQGIQASNPGGQSDFGVRSIQLVQ